jgi:hypothetical protein
MMKAPLLGQKYFLPAVVITALLTLTCILIHVLQLPGWLYMGTAELLLLIVVFALFASHFTPMNIRFNILVYVVGTGIFVIARTHPVLMGKFSFYDGLGPFAGNVGLLLGLPWLISVLFTYPIATRYSENMYARSLFGAVLITVPAYFFLFDADQLMFLYWTELNPSYAALITWFVAGFFFHFAGNQMQVRIENRMAIPLYCMWLGFHLVIFAWKVFG